ncbi:putative porin [Caulobacter mirabilis]|uniref:Porin n=1 Tax=Caulobacter mirabilis TaxID=69666 RepID=A0A2D2B2Y0_9CAUL|nr:putative porin [Caulobacter mirabilis]ATQ44597.1 hypothetical protein CSW64_20480 [Caulobacter mirabilis]
MSNASFAARLLAGAAGGALLLAAGAAGAQTRPTDPSTLDILQVLVDKGVLTQDDANAVLGEARRRAEERKDVVRVPYVPEALRAEIKEEVKTEVLATARQENWAQPDALPGWLNRISFSGDVRVRGEWRNYGDGNTPLIPNVTEIRNRGGIVESATPPFLATNDGRYRTRVRARFGIDAKVNDSIDAGLRFVSGDISDPVSTNETLSPNFDKIDVGLDRAFVRLTPFRDQPMFRQTSAILGKFDNPFFSTEIMWDRDVQFDGVALTTDVALGDHFSAPHLFGTVGAFPLEEFSSDAPDKTLYAAQFGVGYQPTERMKFRLAGAYYYFDNVQGRFNTLGQRNNDETTPRRVQYGNSLFNVRRDNTKPNTVLFGLASRYEVAALTARAEFRLTDALTMAFDAEGLLNTAFDETALTKRYGVPASSGDKAWHLRGTIGSPRVDDAGQWQLSAGWRHIEADSTLDLFTDSDFGLGGTDQEGFVIKGLVGLSPRMSLEASWYSARTLDLIDPLTGARADSIDTDTAQLDLIVKF